MTAARDTIAFKGKSGINVFWPWGGPIVDDPSDPNTRYAPLDTVFGPLANGPWDRHVTQEVYAQCKDVGIDHFRIQCNPGPWMQAFRENDKAYLDGLFEQFDPTIEQSLRAGIGIVLDPYLTGYARDEPASVLVRRNPETRALSPGFLNYQQVVAAFIERYSRYDLVNGGVPESTSTSRRIQPSARGTGRRNCNRRSIGWPEASRLGIRSFVPGPTGPPFLVSSARSSPASYDKNVLWTIHPLIPAPASQQGYIYSQYKYVVGLRYPPSPADKTAAIADMHHRVSADAGLSGTKKASDRRGPGG